MVGFTPGVDGAGPDSFGDTPGQFLDGGGASAARSTRAGFGRYDNRRMIGQGGMGKVTEAADMQFGRLVAVKELLQADASAESRTRFDVEALVTANLAHPGVPAVYERGVTDTCLPFYSKQLVECRALGDAIRDAEGPAERLKLVPAVVKTAQTLSYAHDHGVVHRDVKPENVLVGTHGETFMLDWGIAKVRGLALGSGRQELGPWAWAMFLLG